MPTKLSETVESRVAEEATGCVSHGRGLGVFFADGGERALTAEQAYDELRAGRPVHVPNAGAGRYREFFETVGMKDVEVWDWTSSAGDWVFTLRDGAEGDWYPAFQTNRYPYHGFQFSVNFDMGCETKERLKAVMDSCN